MAVIPNGVIAIDQQPGGQLHTGDDRCAQKGFCNRIQVHRTDLSQ